MLEIITVLLLGTFYGLLVGIIPTAGATTGLVITFSFLHFFPDPYLAVLFCMALVAASTTGDSYASVLLNIPGANSAATTMLDGYPLARQGKANLALSSAIISSTVNGLIWGCLTFLLIPYYKNIVLYMGIPELWAFTLLAFTFVVFISSKWWVRGLIALAFGNESDDELLKLGNYGANKVFTTKEIEKGDSKSISELLAIVGENSNIIVFASTYTSKMTAPRLAAKIKSGIVSNVISLPSISDHLKIKRKSFSGKAIEETIINSEKAIILLATNAYGVFECKTNCEIEKIDYKFSSSINIKNQQIASGKVSLSEAEIVVSAGRGLKGPAICSLGHL